MPTRPNGIYFAILVASLLCGRGWAYAVHNGSPSSARWTTTSQGTTGSVGRPAKLTFSFVPDGTSTIHDTTTLARGPSDLLATLDATFGAGNWLTFYQQSFTRWEELSGLTFTYEDHDDGTTHGSALSPGVNNVRGDIRESGIGIDGSSGTLAYSYFPNVGDQALDTDDMAYFSNSSGDYLRLRNTIMHELGHALGLEHVSSPDAGFLLEPNISTAFDGPQHDDLLGIHWMYGDVYEKTNSGQGNGSYSLATPLGSLATGGSLAIGTAGSGTVIGSSETDFVTIANSSDRDYFSFTVGESVRLDATLTPRGATYSQDSSSLNTLDDSNLSMVLYDTNGTTVLATASSAGAGFAELVEDLVLPASGEYFVRIQGSSSLVQMYQLDLAADSLIPSLLGDYNEDGVVDAADYTVWRDTLGQSVAAYSGADGDGDGLIDSGDYTVWTGAFGSTSSSSTAVPEPGATALLMMGWLFSRRGRTNFPNE